MQLRPHESDTGTHPVNMMEHNCSTDWRRRRWRRKEDEEEEEEEEEKKDREIRVQSLGSVVKEMMYSYNQEYTRESTRI